MRIFVQLALGIVIVISPLFNIYAQENTKAGVKMTNAYDAFGPESTELKLDFGFSCIIEYKGKNILFDAGTNTDIFQKNLKHLKIDPVEIDFVVLSHGHYDHMGGLDNLLSVNPKVKIFLPNDFFSLGAPVKFPFREPEPEMANTLPKEERYFRGDQSVDGMVTVPTGRFWKADVEYLTVAKEIFPGITIVPTSSQLMGTFIKYPPFDKSPQFIGLPELSVSFATPKGQIILAGCSHSTIETIIQETIKINKDKIFLVAGGFHLIPYERPFIENLAMRMKNLYQVESVAPAHCSGHTGFAIFKKVFGEKYRTFGLGQVLSL